MEATTHMVQLAQTPDGIPEPPQVTDPAYCIRYSIQRQLPVALAAGGELQIQNGTHLENSQPCTL